jgi:hypothetical protein
MGVRSRSGWAIWQTHSMRSELPHKLALSVRFYPPCVWLAASEAARRHSHQTLHLSIYRSRTRTALLNLVLASLSRTRSHSKFAHSPRSRSYGTTDDQPEQRRLADPKLSWPKSGTPRWRAPPPPTEPVPPSPTTTKESWAKQKSLTEKKLFGAASVRSQASVRSKDGNEGDSDE